ncbi:rhomboid family intramembrane serine protease [bacterium AH-315-K03]|nr:rhomboid family intramembrane serine protease [bacterium AH-315-K03]
MAEIIVINTSLDEDLAEFSRYLWKKGVPHRVVEHTDRQLLLVGSEEDAEHVAIAYKNIQAGNDIPDIIRSDAKSTAIPQFQPLKSPITTLFVILSIAGYLLVKFDINIDYVGLFTFVELERIGDTFRLSAQNEQYWRLITPIFLHFSLLHLIFNSLWLWDLGRRIERLKGSLKLCGLIILIGVGSNIAQFWHIKASVFGGMSGVIYGLLGYGWMWSRLRPKQSLHIPNPVVYFMLAWLVLCMLGFARLVGAGAIANAAHLGGLIMGLILGAGAAFIARNDS